MLPEDLSAIPIKSIMRFMSVLAELIDAYSEGLTTIAEKVRKDQDLLNDLKKEFETLSNHISERANLSISRSDEFLKSCIANEFQ